MAMTKLEAAKLSNDLLLRGVIETIVKESALLHYLPFMPVIGTAITYNREATLPAAGFYGVGDTWTEATPTFTQHSASLKVLGGDADVDNFLQQTYADTNDIETEVISAGRSRSRTPSPRPSSPAARSSTRQGSTACSDSCRLRRPSASAPTAARSPSTSSTR